MMNYKIAPAKLLVNDSVINDDKILKSLIDKNTKIALITEKKLLIKFNKKLKNLLGFKPIRCWFSGECSFEEIRKITQKIKSADTIIAFGGGKLSDTSKVVSERLNTALITIPTSAATCAAFTSIAPIYFPDGRKLKTVELKKCPDVCIIDYEVLLNQPPRLLSSGIVDAIAKFYETTAFLTGYPEERNDPFITTAFSITEHIYKNVYEFSIRAMRDLHKKKISEGFKKIVYTNIVLAGLVSGIGGKRCRTVVAHAVANGLTHLKQTRNTLHGEKVGFGVLLQLILEEKFDELYKLIRLLRSLGALNKIISIFKGRSYSELKKPLKIATTPDESIRFFFRKVTQDDLWNAILKLNDVINST